MNKLLSLSFFSIVLAGCAPANIIAVKWDSPAGPTIQTRCEKVDMRSKAEMDATFAKYDGWKLVYLSEYTTGNLIGTSAAVCFEKGQ